MTITNTTLSGNSAINFGGAIFTKATFNIKNSIIAGNTAPTGPDISVFGIFTSGGYNLVGNTSGSTGFGGTDLLNVAALLGPLANNGGFTQTQRPQPSSPAIDAIPGCNGGPATDQRGVSRPQGVNCDIGAVEQTPLILNPPTLPNGVIGSTYNQTVTASGGTAPYMYAVTVGALPPGLTLTSSTGVINGIPTTSGTYPFTVTATDAFGNTGSRAYTIVIAAPTPTDTATATHTATLTNTPSLTPTGTRTNTSTPTGTSTQTRTATPTNTSTGTRTATPTSSATSIQTLTATQTSILTFTPTGTGTVTSTRTSTPSATNTVTGTSTGTRIGTNTPTPTGTLMIVPPSITSVPGTSALVFADPVLVKFVDIALIRPGETAIFTITARNQGTAPANAVFVNDPLPDILQILSVTTSQGTYSVSEQTVVFNLGTINPSETVTMTITTRARTDIKPPVDATNGTILTFTGGTARTAQAQFRITSGSLPGTGERPDGPSAPLGIATLLIVVVGVSAFAIYSRKGA